MWFCCAVVGITCFPGSQNPELMIISNPSMSRRRTRPTSLLFWQIKQHRYFFLEDTFARSDDWRVLQRFEQRNSFNEVAQQDDAYTAPDVQDNTDVPNIFENHHVNYADEKIACRAVDIQELIKNKPTFEDVEDEEEDDTMGNYDLD